ncbi:S41 family peptidase [Arenimonas sp.]|uniref:S41 family peptidase n=1 Tax=Arenimonas sp. TaxID=1872635 RepID=UPI0039E3617E
MFKFLRRSFFVLASLLALVVAWDVLTYDAKAWQADYSRLKQDMAQGYANLDWIVEQRKLDLPRLDRETSAAIDNAHSRVRAFLAIRRFIKAFRDPHFRLKIGDRPIDENAQLVTASSLAAEATDDSESIDPPAGADCAAAGYEEEDHAFDFPFDRIEGFQTVSGGNFPTALIGRIGVLRIAQFGEDRYLGECTQAFKAGIGSYALRLAVRARLQAELTTKIRALQEKGATRLLIDLSGNGGGTEWVSEAIVLMTDKPMSRQNARLIDARCDRSGVWRGEKPCPVLEPVGERATLQGQGVWTGPVTILVDGNTGSASEDFVAWLQQNGIATVIGERTAGAGCGYINGGTRTQFRASPFDARMPNCARYLDNGRNEIEGLAPDVELPMRSDDALAKANALAAALRDARTAGR